MKKRVVFIMSYPWYSLYQRPNHFARQFKMIGYGIDVIEMRHVVRLNSILNRMTFEEHRSDIDQLVSVVKFPFARLESFQLAGKIRKILRGHTADTEFVFWFQGFDDAIDYHRILPLIPFRKVLDVSDSFPDFVTDMRQAQRLQEAGRTVAVRADMVLTSAEVLHKKFKSYNPRTYLVKNAVDLSRYENLSPPDDPHFMRKLESKGRESVVAYQGSISSWFDFDLMNAVMRKCPDFLFLFMGMVDVTTRGEFRRLGRNRNFHYIGVVEPKHLPWILSKINVGIIPFRINDLIRATNPIKLYEYLAAAKPVVATPMPEVMRYEAEGIVATAEDPDDFANLLRRMRRSSENPQLRHERLSIARKNSWDERFQKILEYMPELRIENDRGEASLPSRKL